MKPIFFFLVLPAFILGLDETGLADPRYVKGVIFFLCWAIAERRMFVSEQALRTEVSLDGSNWFTVGSRVAAFLLALNLIAMTGRALAGDYYVDAANGNDGQAGTAPQSAWRTLARVNRFAFHPGDSVHLARGSIWREDLKPAAPGASNFAGVMFTAYGNGQLPTINGSDPITRWSRSDSGVYSSPVAGRVFNVFADGQPGWGLAHACCGPSQRCSATSPKAYIKGQTCAIGAMQPGSWYWSEAGGSGGTLYVWLPDSSDPSAHFIEAVTRPFGVIANPELGPR